MISEYLEELDKEMESSLQFLAREFSRLHAGRASVAMLDPVRVEYYGSPTPLSQVASLSVPEPRMIVAKPWDTNLLKAIERAIRLYDSSLNPISDGQTIRLILPELTEERRKELVRKVGRIGEDARVRVRQVRRDYNDLFKKMEKEGEVSEDDNRRAQELIQKGTDSYVSKIDERCKNKEAELLQV